jgi:hypothetical protein
MRTAVFLVLALAVTESAAPEEGFLYKAQFVQAAPGRLLDLIDLVKAKTEEPPFAIRHSQGDRWDLMILTRADADYFSPERPETQVFVRDQGAGWDLFTVGFYRDLKHYAESADIPEKD